MKKVPVIIDCDPGLDDVIALIMAFASEKLDVKAVTVVGGNQTLEKVSNNALRVLSYAGIDVAVGLGCRGPLVRKLVTTGEVHGDDGLYGVKLPDATLKADELHAVDLIAKVLNESEEKITLIPMGPLTNIAMFIHRYPELTHKIERISLMGGAVNGGNRTPSAEFNIYVDPEAADIVFRSGIPITMVGLNVTHKAPILREDIEKIGSIDNKIAKMVSEMLDNLSKFHAQDGIDGCFLHDPVAVCSVINPEMLTTKLLHVAIELKGEYTRGATVVDLQDRWGLNKNVDVALEIDRKTFIDEIIKSVKNINLK